MKILGEEEARKYPVRDGLYIVERHAELIANGEKTLVVKSRKFDVAGKRYYLITEDRILGEIELGAPERIGEGEFDARGDEHAITSKEKKAWWPDYERFWAYEIQKFKRFDPPLAYNRKPGVQTFQNDVEPIAKIGERREMGVSEGRPPAAKHVVVFLSGGKDSTASLLWAVDKYPRKKIIALYSHSDDYAWPGLRKYVEEMCKKLNVRLYVTEPEVDFFEELDKRGHWPFALVPWCNSLIKTVPTRRFLMKNLNDEKDKTVLISGERKSENKGRPGKLGSDRTKTSELKNLAGWKVYKPLFNRTDDEVWKMLKDSKVKPFKTYGQGFPRLSCWGCPLANSKHFALLRKYYPKLYKKIEKQEEKIGRPIKEVAGKPVEEGKFVKAIADYGERYVPDIELEESRPPKARNYIVLFSGGKDSSAVLGWAAERYDKDKIKALFVSMRGYDFPGLKKHVKKVCKKVGVEVHVVQNNETFEHALKRHKEWPHFPDFWCNKELKGKPTRRQLKEYDPEKDIVMEGSRKAESRDRDKKLKSKWTGIAALGKKWRVYRPIMNWSEEKVYEYLEEQGIPLFHTYEKGWDRLSCWGCPRGNSTQFSLLREHYPKLFEKLVKWERNYGPIDKERTAKHKANYGDGLRGIVEEARRGNIPGSVLEKLMAEESVAKELSKVIESREIEFNLLHRSWKGPTVVRGGRRGHDYVVLLPLNDRGFTAFHFRRSPIGKEYVAGTMERTDDEFFNFEGQIPAENPVNPLKRLPMDQEILDKGEAVVLEDSETFIKIIFKGKKWTGTWAFEKMNGLWKVSRSTGPGGQR